MQPFATHVPAEGRARTPSRLAMSIIRRLRARDAWASSVSGRTRGDGQEFPEAGARGVHRNAFEVRVGLCPICHAQRGLYWRFFSPNLFEGSFVANLPGIALGGHPVETGSHVNGAKPAPWTAHSNSTGISHRFRMRRTK